MLDLGPFGQVAMAFAAGAGTIFGFLRGKSQKDEAEAPVALRDSIASLQTRITDGFRDLNDRITDGFAANSSAAAARDMRLHSIERQMTAMNQQFQEYARITEEHGAKIHLLDDWRTATLGRPKGQSTA